MHDRTQREEEIFLQALDREAGPERTSFLDEACGVDDALRRSIEALLAAHDDPATVFSGDEGKIGLPSGSDSSDGALEDGNQPGDELGPYQLVEVIGRGGMGTVWRAEQSKPVKREVALKIIKLGMDTREVVARFEAERQALAMMEHPNIAKVYDAGTTELGRPYFAMELVRGISITRFCDEQLLRTEERLRLFIQVCIALQHAHQKGVIHRDLKPSNVLVAMHDGVPVPKVIDFGIAKAVEGRLTDQSFVTNVDKFLGTPAWMSPEQARQGQPAAPDIDTRTDIYNLGALLYEILTGRPPFHPTELAQAGFDEIRRRIIEDDPAKPSTCLGTMLDNERTRVARCQQTEPPKLVGRLRGDLDWIVMKSLEKDRNRRYETANGLAMDVQRHLDQEAVLARPPSSLYQFGKLVRRNGLLFGASGSVAAALTIGLVTSSALLLREREARQRADKAESDQAELRQRAEGQELLTRGYLYLVDMNLAHLAYNDGNRQRASYLIDRNVPRPDQTELRGWEWRYLWSLCRSDELFTLGWHENAVTCLAVSKDGSRILSGSYDGTVRLWDLEQRQELKSLSHPSVIHCIQYFPKKDWFVYGMGSQVIIREGRSFGRLTGFELEGAARAVALSPDETYLAYFDTSGVIKVRNLLTNEEERSYQTEPTSGSLWGALAFSPDGKWLAATDLGKGVRVINIHTNEEKTLPHEGLITRFLFSRDGDALYFSGTFNRTICWDLTSDQLTELQQLGHWTSCLSLSPNQGTLAVSSADQTVRLLDVRDIGNCQEIATYFGHRGEVWAVAFLPGGQRIVSGGKDGSLRVWSASPDHHDSPGLPNDARQLAFSMSGDRWAMVNQDGDASIGTTVNMKSSERLIGEFSPVTAMTFSPDGASLVTGHTDGLLRSWDSETRIATRDIHRHTESIMNVHISRGAQTLAFVDHEGSVQRVNMGTGALEAQASISLQRDARPVAALAPDHSKVAYASGTDVVLVDLDSGEELARFTDHRETVREVAYSPNGRWIASASEDTTVRAWDVELRQQTAVLHGEVAWSVTFSADSTRVAAGMSGGLVKLWDTSTWEEALTLTIGGVEGRAEQVLLTPDGNSIIAWGFGTEKWSIWRAPTKQSGR